MDLFAGLCLTTGGCFVTTFRTAAGISIQSVLSRAAQEILIFLDSLDEWLAAIGPVTFGLYQHGKRRRMLERFDLKSQHSPTTTQKSA